MLTLSLSPVLKIGFTFAFFHVPGKTPDSLLLLIIYIMLGVKIFGAIFSNFGPKESNPVAFVASILDK